jgi:predicted Zn-dependent protease
MVPSYSRLADEEPERKTVLLGRVQNLLASALASDLRDPEAFNSLAWELAMRREFPEQTLAAARRAHDLAPEAPHIMDTLAEAHYAAGMYDEAIHWEQEALRRTPDDGFLKKQLARFELRGKE